MCTDGGDTPPYWSLRDYGTNGQTGRDDTLDDYVKSIVAVFDRGRRVLADDGTVWLNVGDSYTSGNRRYRAPDRKNRARAMRVRPATPEGLKPKDLIGVPWRLALALQDAGWWLRAEVIWHKPNAQPESVRDCSTKAHEIVFLLSKSQDYHYDIDTVQGPNSQRLRTVWDINTEPGRHRDGAIDHPAVMPIKLARQCVAITSRPGDAVADPPKAQTAATTPTRINAEPDWIEYFGYRISVHHGITADALGLSAFEAAFW